MDGNESHMWSDGEKAEKEESHIPTNGGLCLSPFETLFTSQRAAGRRESEMGNKIYEFAHKLMSSSATHEGLTDKSTCLTRNLI